VKPEPVIGILAYLSFYDISACLGDFQDLSFIVFSWGKSEWAVDDNLVGRGWSRIAEGRKKRRVCPQEKSGQARSGCRFFSEEIDKDSLLPEHILVDEEGDDLVGSQGLKNLLRRPLLVDDSCSKACPQFEQFSLNKLIIQRTSNHIQPALLFEEVRRDFPVSIMGGEEQDTFIFLECSIKILLSLDLDERILMLIFESWEFDAIHDELAEMNEGLSRYPSELRIFELCAKGGLQVGEGNQAVLFIEAIDNESEHPSFEKAYFTREQRNEKFDGFKEKKLPSLFYS